MKYVCNSLRKPMMAAVFATVVGISQVYAQSQQWCSGKLSNFWIDSTGAAYVLPTWRSDYIQFCNVTTAWKGVPADVCKGWVTTVRSAVALKSNTVTFYFSASACNAMPTYATAPAPYYLMLVD